MHFYLDISWMYFCIFFGAMLLISFIMNLQNMNFYTMHVVIRKFSIIDLEFPASALELVTFIKGIFLLPVELSKKSLRSLKGQLFLDYLFMPAAYGSIFILCMKVSLKMVSFGHILFAILAWLQVIAWLCDIIKNIYLFNKIGPAPAVSKPGVHIACQVLEMLKWGIALTGAVCSIAAIFYFWLVGRYSEHSIQYLLIIAAEIIVIFIAKKITIKSEKENLQKFQQTVS
ncbi:MAG: hypothetical protein ABI834_00610 [Ginsengibacter sp.]